MDPHSESFFSYLNPYLFTEFPDLSSYSDLGNICTPSSRILVPIRIWIISVHRVPGSWFLFGSGKYLYTEFPDLGFYSDLDNICTLSSRILVSIRIWIISVHRVPGSKFQFGSGFGNSRSKSLFGEALRIWIHISVLNPLIQIRDLSESELNP